MTNELCVSCHEPLLAEIESDSDEEVQTSSSAGKGVATSESVLDDVELNCGCHFHCTDQRECFLDSATITECPNCNRNISSLQPGTSQQQVLVTVRNEGGVQPNFDILPSATEEAYLRAYPEERRGHALLEFVREGDLDAVVHLLRDDDEDNDDEDDDDNINDGEQKRAGGGGVDVDLLRYVGTFEGIQGSALHVAVRYHREELAWLLLALGSGLSWDQFPPGAVGVLNSLGLGKDDRRATPDVRTIKDAEGRLPLDVARQEGGGWMKWVESGRLG